MNADIRNYAIVLSAIGTISCASSLFILFTIFYFKLYKSLTTRLIMYLAISGKIHIFVPKQEKVTYVVYKMFCSLLRVNSAMRGL